jgi:2'-5' RNA ligase
MPFPGIPAGSELEAKIDRCVKRVMATGRDKSRAIAICRASMAGTAQKEDDREFASTQFDMPAFVAQKVLEYGRLIPAEDLHKNGLEDEVHVTIKYGLQDDQLDRVKILASMFGPMTLEFKGINLFRRDDFDVVKVDVESEALRRLNRAISMMIQTDDPHPVFNPHLTIAYVKPGLGQKYVGSGPLNGQSVIVDTIQFSGTDYSKTPIKLAQTQATKSEQDAITQANYRDAGPASTQICATCRFGANTQKQCSLFKFVYKDNWTCDRWRPNIEATRNRLRQLQDSQMNAEKRKELIEQARQRIALKREIPQRVRRDLGRGDFVFPETRSFPIVKPEDVRAAVSSWGRASAVRARGFTFEDFKRRLTAIARRKGAAFVAALPADWKGGQSEKATFTVFKDSDGNYRWLSISSTAYRDRDGEIVSLKALADDVERKDATGDYGPLRFWHVPGWDIGDCTFNMMYGKSLVEGGTFRRKEYAEALIKNPPGGISIAFRHPLTEPDQEKVFSTISRFERSTIPQIAKPSNLFTSFISLKDGTMPTQEEKLQELVKTFGEQARGILAQAQANEKEAEAQGVAFKELGETELSQLSADALLEYALAKKEYEEAQAAQAAKQNSTHPANEDEDMPTMMRRVMKMLETHDAAIKELQASRKEAATQQAQPEPPSLYKEMDERLKALESDQPPALQRGYRASQDGAPVEDAAKEELTEREKAMKAAMEKNPEIAPFAHVGASFGSASNPAAFGGHPYWGAPWQQPPNATQPPPAK